VKHYQIVKEIVKKYKADKNVVGIYVFGSLAIGKVKESSDVDIEVVMKKQKEKYKLLHPKMDKVIHIDLSLPREEQFIKDFTKFPYTKYAELNYKILYDPKRVLKKYLKMNQKYFKDNLKILKFWKNEERKWGKYKKTKYNPKKKNGARNYFELIKELKKNKGVLK
jgi:predicted nucleotidyltransferase